MSVTIVALEPCERLQHRICDLTNIVYVVLHVKSIVVRVWLWNLDGFQKIVFRFCVDICFKSSQRI